MKNKGFTLLELLSVITIISCITMFTMTLSTEAEQAIFDYQKFNSSQSELYQQYLKHKENE